MLLVNSGKEYRFHIFCDDITKEDLEKLRITAEKFNTIICIYYLNISLLENFSKDMAGHEHISIGAYFRFIAFGALSDICSKVLYLDSDICILDNKIKDFWNIDLKDKIAIVKKEISLNHDEIRLGVKQIFNSGVIFVDINKWNKRNLTELCINKSMERVWPFLDQDVLNIVLDGYLCNFSERYNYGYNLSTLINNENKPSKISFKREEATVLHFVGPSKPWHSWTKYCQVTNIYYLIKSKSEWRDIPLEGPETKGKLSYKYFHKAARVAKKENDFRNMFLNYICYCKTKIIYLSKRLIKI